MQLRHYERTERTRIQTHSDFWIFYRKLSITNYRSFKSLSTYDTSIGITQHLTPTKTNIYFRTKEKLEYLILIKSILVQTKSIVSTNMGVHNYTNIIDGQTCKMTFRNKIWGKSAVENIKNIIWVFKKIIVYVFCVQIAITRYKFITLIYLNTLVYKITKWTDFQYQLYISS